MCLGVAARNTWAWRKFLVVGRFSMRLERQTPHTPRASTACAPHVFCHAPHMPPVTPPRTQRLQAFGEVGRHLSGQRL